MPTENGKEQNSIKINASSLDDYNIIVADFETMPLLQYELEHPKDLVWLSAFRGASGSVTIVRSMQEFLQKLAETFAQEEGKTNICYFHNGAKFDFKYLLYAFQYEGYIPCTKKSRLKPKEFTYTIDEHKNVLKIVANINGVRINFKDSFKIIPQSVATLAGGEKPYQIDYYKSRYITDELTPIEIEYIREDVNLVYDRLQTCLPYLAITKWFGKKDVYGLRYANTTIRNTISATALEKIKIELSHFYKTHLLNQFNEEEVKFIHKGYHGGMVMANKKYLNIPIYEDCYKYDVNSMYPYIMSLRLPYGGCTEQGDVSLHQIFIGRAILKKGYQPYLGVATYLSKKYLNTIENMTFTMWDFEWEHVQTVYNISYAQIVSSKSFKTEAWAKNFVNRNYTLRKSLGKDTAENYVAKIIMNAVYGKMAEKPHDLQYHLSVNAEGTYDWTLNHIDNSKSKSYVAGGAYITAMARVKLHKAITENRDNFLYADTDSIITIGEAKGLEIDPNTLGAWKFEGKTNEFITRGAKAYYFNKLVLAGCPQRVRDSLNFKAYIEGGTVDILKTKTIANVPFIIMTKYNLSQNKT